METIKHAYAVEAAAAPEGDRSPVAAGGTGETRAHEFKVWWLAKRCGVVGSGALRKGTVRGPGNRAMAKRNLPGTPGTKEVAKQLGRRRKLLS